MSRDAATVGRSLFDTLGMYAALAAAEFRRYATYRQALIAAMFTNSVFGRAGFAALTRLIGPVLIGALAFTLYLPRHPVTYPLFVVSTTLATMVCFACRYLVNATTYWLLDSRGAQIVWVAVSSLLSGIAFPLAFLPAPLATALYLGTPFPYLIQVPADVLIERHPVPTTAALVAAQAGWVVIMLTIARAVQRRAERRLVIQGG